MPNKPCIKMHGGSVVPMKMKAHFIANDTMWLLCEDVKSDFSKMALKFEFQTV